MVKSSSDKLTLNFKFKCSSIKIIEENMWISNTIIPPIAHVIVVGSRPRPTYTVRPISDDLSLGVITCMC